jgi:hypothetical protein
MMRANQPIVSDAQVVRGSTLHERPKPRKAGRRGSVVQLVIACSWLFASTAGQARSIRYDIATDRDLTAITVDACFGQQVPAVLLLNEAVPSRVLSGLRTLDQPRGRVRAMTQANGCAHYALDLTLLPNGNPHSGFQRLAHAILLDPTWLLAVPISRTPTQLDLRFLLPSAFQL